MLSSFVAFFSRDFSYEKAEQKKTNNKVTNLLLYRDAYLIKNKKPKKGDADDGGKLERRSRHASSASTAVAEEKIGSGIRVKVRMTKAEAARLLSKCKEGGVLGFKDVENELVQIPMNRVHVLPPATTTTYTRAAVLKSIPEEP